MDIPNYVLLLHFKMMLMRFCECPIECEYPVFGTDKITGKGYCKSHQYLRTDLDKRSITEKAMDRNKRTNKNTRDHSKVRNLINSDKNKLVANEAAASIDALQRFFDKVATEIAQSPRCWECNQFIPIRYYRAATAHILPKAIFKSIATHPLNYLILGAGCGCHNKTHRLDTFSQMKIFPEAVSRFKQFEHLIKEKHALLDEFINYANAINKNQ